MKANLNELVENLTKPVTLVLGFNSLHLAALRLRSIGEEKRANESHDIGRDVINTYANGEYGVFLFDAILQLATKPPMADASNRVELDLAKILMDLQLASVAFERIGSEAISKRVDVVLSSLKSDIPIHGLELLEQGIEKGTKAVIDSIRISNGLPEK